MSASRDVNAEAGKYWDEQIEKAQTSTVTRTRWWDDDTTKRHINGILGRPDMDAVHGAFHQEIAKRLAGKSNLKAISVGCGVGTKEMWLMQMIDVVRFDLIDVSPACIALGRAEAERQGVLDKVNLYVVAREDRLSD